MENNEGYVLVKIVPFKKPLGGVADNLSPKERNDMSCTDKYIVLSEVGIDEKGNFLYCADRAPLCYNGNISVTRNSAFLFDDLSSDEQECYVDKVVEVLVSRESYYKLVGIDNSKKLVKRKEDKRNK